MPNRVLIEPEEFAELLAAGDRIFIDTREPEDFAAGHIPGAVNIPEIFSFLTEPGDRAIEEIVRIFAGLFGSAGLSGAQRAVIYEQSMDGGLGQSCRGYFLLKVMGYPRASVLHGGLDAWIDLGLPVTRNVTAPNPQAFPVVTDLSEIIVDAQEMLAALDDPGIVKLDVRDFDEWFGISSSPYGIDYCPRKGRIPEARWLEWYRMMKPGPAGPMFKNRDEILAECRTVGISEDTPVILYCFKGARTSNTFVALKEAGIKNVRNYFGSWNEWSRNPDLPIDEGVLGSKDTLGGEQVLEEEKARGDD
jgi:thiosulfate/3-mercaptopyruvate sulfurtransferase